VSAASILGQAPEACRSLLLRSDALLGPFEERLQLLALVVYFTIQNNHEVPRTRDRRRVISNLAPRRRVTLMVVFFSEWGA